MCFIVFGSFYVNNHQIFCKDNICECWYKTLMNKRTMFSSWLHSFFHSKKKTTYKCHPKETHSILFCLFYLPHIFLIHIMIYMKCHAHFLASFESNISISTAIQMRVQRHQLFLLFSLTFACKQIFKATIDISSVEILRMSKRIKFLMRRKFELKFRKVANCCDSIKLNIFYVLNEMSFEDPDNPAIVL